MKNPKLPWRTIQHAPLLLKAGFKLDVDGWMKPDQRPDANCAPINTHVNQLCYWKRDNLVVTFFDYQRGSLKKLVTKIIAQAKYETRKSATIVFKE